ncbi:MAG TPA: HEPN domain-containing protein [Chitinophagaceae bacterium]
MELILNIACAQHSQVVCSLHNEGSVLEGLRAGHFFYCFYCTADNLVYDDKVTEYPIAIPETLSVIRQKTAETFNRYFQKVQDFYSSAVMLRKDGSSPLIMFILHQSVECIYRGSLQSFNGYDKKTHEIRVLMKQVRHRVRRLNYVFTDSIPENKRLIQLLDMAYINARYEKEYSIEEKDLALIFEKVKLLHDLAKTVAERTLCISL